MDLFEQLSEALRLHGERNAFHIQGVFHTYAQLSGSIAAQKAWIRRNMPAHEQLVALIGNDDLHTYASILALWSEGKAYLPLSPKAPLERNRTIVDKAGVTTLFMSAANAEAPGITEVRTDLLPPSAEEPTFADCARDVPAYVLFTSGTTGVPKGVPITRGNLAAFVDAYASLGITLESDDRCLQMFELTFDVSVLSYLMPLLRGACVYTVPPQAIKFLYIAELMADHALTMAAMVPSVIAYLRPYFSELDLPALQHCLFAGEALPVDLITEWAACAPSARIINAYGPTEHTIICTWYVFDRAGNNKQRNGILSIGKAMPGSSTVVVDEQRNILPAEHKGELCLSGHQLTLGYMNDPERTAEAMFEMEHVGVRTRFYRSGDLCLIDADGDIMYLGRIDQQAKIQGFRVELTEVEHHARIVLAGGNVAAIAVQNAMGLTEIALVVEGENGDADALRDRLRATLPPYMIPTQVCYLPAFPLGSSGKTDRNALRNLLINVSVKPAVVNIRGAVLSDVEFLVEAIVSAEKSNSDKLGLATLFELSEDRVRVLLRTMLEEEVDDCEFAISGFLVAEVDGAPAAAVCGWVEADANGMSSGLLKSNLIGFTYPEEALQALARHADVLSGIRIDRAPGALQIEYVHVAAAYRGMGLAGRLIDAHITAAVMLEPVPTKAQVQLFSNNHGALRVYERCGFRHVRTFTSTDPRIVDLLPFHEKLLLEKALT